MAKLSRRSISKINQRYIAKTEEFKKSSFKELLQIVDLKAKMSYTDRLALGQVIQQKLTEQANEKSSNTGENN